MVPLDPLSVFLYCLNSMHNNWRWIYKYNIKNMVMQGDWLFIEIWIVVALILDLKL